MKLDRNAKGRNKYGLIKNRRLDEILAKVGDSRNARNYDEVNAMKVREAVQLLVEEGVIDWGDTTETEFFVIRLRDEYASGALAKYALLARLDDNLEYGREVQHLANRAGINHPNCKKPD